VPVSLMMLCNLRCYSVCMVFHSVLGELFLLCKNAVLMAVIQIFQLPLF